MLYSVHLSKSYVGCNITDTAFQLNGFDLKCLQLLADDTAQLYSVNNTSQTSNIPHAVSVLPQAAATKLKIWNQMSQYSHYKCAGRPTTQLKFLVGKNQKDPNWNSLPIPLMTQAGRYSRTSGHSTKTITNMDSSHQAAQLQDCLAEKVIRLLFSAYGADLQA